MSRSLQEIICIKTAAGKQHDFKLFKNSNVHFHPDSHVLIDSGYQGIAKFHTFSELPKKNSKKKPLAQEDKNNNKAISSLRVFVENIISRLKRFKIIAEKYRNRRKRFGLRMNLICGIHNIDFC